jgi:hypothetical protein
VTAVKLVVALVGVVQAVDMMEVVMRVAWPATEMTAVVREEEARVVAVAAVMALAAVVPVEVEATAELKAVVQ